MIFSLKCIMTVQLLPNKPLGSLKQYCQQYHRRISELENEKYDLEVEVEFKQLQVE